MEQNIKLPQHIAIIMDGNGRWAKKRLLPRSAGHKVGAKTLEDIAEYANKIGINHLTVYAFSTENWSRPDDEVQGIMELLENYLNQTKKTIIKRNIKMNFLGDLTPFSDKIKSLIDEIKELSTKCTGNSLNICINYGGRQDIVNSVNTLISQNKEITEENISKNLYTYNMPDPDLVIRPSGELRISNFLLWQIAYSEFYYSNILWPDFKESDLDKAILEYNKRNRRFGGV